MSQTKLILLYANGNFGKSCLANLVEIYALFYFTDLLGIDPGVAGFTLLVSLILDALTDPLVGHLADRWSSKWRSLVPYALVGVPLTTISFLLLFVAPGSAGSSAELVAIAGLLCFRLAYTLFDVPHNGLIAVVTRTPEQRTTAASLRIFFSALGKLTVTIIVAWLIERGGKGTLDAGSLSSASLILAGFFVISVGISAHAVRKVSFQSDEGDIQKARFTDIGRAILHNRQVLNLFALTAANSLMVPATTAAFIYYAKYGLQNEALGTQAVMVLALVQTASLLFWAVFTNRIGSKPVAGLTAYAVLVLGSGLGVWFADDAASVLAVAGLIGFAVGGIFMLNWSMLPDALDKGRSVAPSPGLLGIFGIYTLTNKAFSGLAQAYVGLVLTAVGYTANSALPPGLIDDARMGMFALPLVGACICIAILFGYERAR